MLSRRRASLAESRPHSAPHRPCSEIPPAGRHAQLRILPMQSGRSAPNFERDTAIAADTRIEPRIGINLGDVIVEGGVNIAARIEALADPGGVFVSNTVHDHARDRVYDLTVAFDP